MKSLTRKFSHSRNVFIIIEQFLYSGIFFSINILFGKNLSKANFGLWVMVNSLFFFVLSLLNSSFWKTFIINYVKKKYDSKNYSTTIYLFSNLVNIVVLPISIAVLFYVNNISVNFFISLIILGVFFINNELVRYSLIAKGQRIELFYFTLLRFLLLCIGLISLFYLELFSLNLAIITLILAYGVCLVKKIRNQKLPSLKKISIYYEIWKKDWAGNKWLLLKALLHYFTAQVYILLIGFFTGLDNAAEFETIRIYFAPIIVFSTGLNNIFVTYFSKLKDKYQVIKFYNNFLLFIIAISFCVSFYTVLILCFGQELETILFGGRYYNQQDSGNIIIFAIANFSSSLIIFFNTLFVIANKQYLSYKISLIAFIINLGFAPFFLSKYGAYGGFLGISVIQSCILLFNILSFLWMYREELNKINIS